MLGLCHVSSERPNWHILLLLKDLSMHEEVLRDILGHPDPQGCEQQVTCKVCTFAIARGSIKVQRLTRSPLRCQKWRRMILTGSHGASWKSGQWSDAASPRGHGTAKLAQRLLLSRRVLAVLWLAKKNIPWRGRRRGAGWGVGARDVRNAADFLFCVRYAARERVSPCKKMLCFFQSPF